MNKFYAICTDEVVGPEYTDTETRVCFNFGFYIKESDAILACVSANAKAGELHEECAEMYYTREFEVN